MFMCEGLVRDFVMNWTMDVGVGDIKCLCVVWGYDIT